MRTAGPISVLAATLALAGCGGPDIDLGAGRGLSSPAGDFDGAAATVCREVAQRFDEIQADPPRTFAQAGVVLGALLDAARGGEEQLRALDPPAGRAAAFARYLAARGDVIEQLERAREAAAAEQGGAYERARDAALESATLRFKLATRAGLNGCAKVERG